MKYDNCPICNSDIKRWIIKKTESGLFDIDSCNSCGFAFVNPRPDLDFLMKFYSVEGHGKNKNEITTLSAILEQEKKYPNSTVDAKRMMTIILKLLNNSNYANEYKLLDVGCGYGFFSKEALENGFEVTALELAATEREIANQMTGLRPIEKSFEDFQSGKQIYDVVLMSQILEHAFDVNLWMNKAFNIIKPNGIISIAVPNYNSIFRKVLQSKDPFICPPAHLNFFSLKSLSQLLSKHGFKIYNVQYVSRIPKDSIKNRLARFGKILPNLIGNSVPLMLKVIDSLHLGMFINIYAKKV